MRNGHALEGRYTRNQLIELYKEQRELEDLGENLSELYIGEGEHTLMNGVTQSKWSRREELDSSDTGTGIEMCWDRRGASQPSVLFEMTDEEKEVSSFDKASHSTLNTNNCNSYSQTPSTLLSGPPHRPVHAILRSAKGLEIGEARYRRATTVARRCPLQHSRGQRIVDVSRASHIPFPEMRLRPPKTLTTTKLHPPHMQHLRAVELISKISAEIRQGKSPPFHRQSVDL